MSYEDRITELETRIAFQDDTIQQLNEAVARQQKQIDQLSARHDVLVEKLADLSVSGAGTGDSHEPPPHY